MQTMIHRPRPRFKTHCPLYEDKILFGFLLELLKLLLMLRTRRKLPTRSYKKFSIPIKIVTDVLCKTVWKFLSSKFTSFKWFQSTGLFRTFILIFKLFKVSFYDVIRRVLRNKYLNTKLFIQMSRKSFFSQYAISHLYVKMLWL